MIVIIQPDGTVAYDELPGTHPADLDTLQRHLGGDPQLVPIEFHHCNAFAHRDGVDLELARNTVAEHVLGWPDPLHGNIVITGGQVEHQEVGLHETQWRALHAAMAPRPS